MAQLKPSRVGLLPCLLLFILWLIVPLPHLTRSPDVDPSTRLAAMKALEASKKRYINSRVAPISKLQKPEQLSDHPKVLIVTAIAPKPCKSEGADYLTVLSLKNKQDYARRQGYEFMVATHQSDQKLSGAWNKVGLLKELLDAQSDYSWFMWIDYDALIMDVNFELPLEKYDGKDLVLWGQERELFEQADPHMGLNTGVLLLRNSDWSRKFINETSLLGTGNGKDSETLFIFKLSKYDWALFDQNGFTYTLKYWQPELSKFKTYLEQSYVINGYWKDWLVLDKLPFVKHYMGCQFCSGINTQELPLCRSDFLASFAVADKLARSSA